MFDVSDDPSFNLSLLFAFSLPLRLLFSLTLRLLFSLPLRLLLPLPLRLPLPLPLRVLLPFSLHTLLRASCLCSLVALSLTYLHRSGSCGLCASVAALIVSRSVSKFCASYRVQDVHLTSASRETTLQQSHQHRSISTSIQRLPLFQKSSPDLESIHWIAHSHDHLDCSIFRVHYQHERKLLHSFLSSIAHSRQEQFSQRIRCHICKFRTGLFINRKRLWLVSNPEVN